MLSHKDIEILEKKHRAYKNKKRMKSFIAVFVTIFIIGLLAYPLLDTKEKVSVVKQPTNISHESLEVNTTQKMAKVAENLTKELETVKNDEINETVVQKEEVVKEAVEKEEENSTKTVLLKQSDSFISQVEEQIEKDNLKKDLKKDSNINVSSKQIDKIEYLIKSYQKEKTFENAINLANGYLEKKMYQNSVKYSLEANNIDATKEESWIIFAKAKYFMGDKTKAIKALTSYLGQYPDSSKSSKLLEQIQSGEL